MVEKETNGKIEEISPQSISINLEEREGKLYAKVFLNGDIIYSDWISKINLETLEKGITKNIDLRSPGGDWEILAKGCGIYGCCGGLAWDLIHKDDHLIIKHIELNSLQVYIDGCNEKEYKVSLEDYCIAVKNVKAVVKKLRPDYYNFIYKI